MLAHRHGTQDLHLFSNIKGEVLLWNKRGETGGQGDRGTGRQGTIIVSPALLMYSV